MLSWIYRKVPICKILLEKPVAPAHVDLESQIWTPLMAKHWSPWLWGLVMFLSNRGHRHHKESWHTLSHLLEHEGASTNPGTYVCSETKQCRRRPQQSFYFHGSYHGGPRKSRGHFRDERTNCGGIGWLENRLICIHLHMPKRRVSVTIRCGQVLFTGKLRNPELGFVFMCWVGFTEKCLSAKFC